MALEKGLVEVGLCFDVSAGQACHGFKQGGDVIFGIEVAVGALDAKFSQIFTHPTEWALVEEARQIERGVGEQFAPPDADEEIEKLPARSALVGRACRIRQLEVGET